MRGENSWTRVLGSKAKLSQKRYGFVPLGVSKAKMYLKKAEDIKEKFMTQNASICKRIKLESIF